MSAKRISLLIPRSSSPIPAPDEAEAVVQHTETQKYLSDCTSTSFTNKSNLSARSTNLSQLHVSRKILRVSPTAPLTLIPKRNKPHQPQQAVLSNSSECGRANEILKHNGPTMNKKAQTGLLIESSVNSSRENNCCLFEQQSLVATFQGKTNTIDFANTGLGELNLSASRFSHAICSEFVDEAKQYCEFEGTKSMDSIDFLEAAISGGARRNTTLHHLPLTSCNTPTSDMFSPALEDYDEALLNPEDKEISSLLPVSIESKNKCILKRGDTVKEDSVSSYRLADTFLKINGGEELLLNISDLRNKVWSKDLQSSNDFPDPTSASEPSDAMITKRGAAIRFHHLPPRSPTCYSGSDAAFMLIEMLQSAFDPFSNKIQFTDTMISQLKRLILLLCDTLLANKREPPIIKCSGPILVCGDLHGSFADAFYFLNQAAPFRNPKFLSTPLLFLGDYVDRGDHSVETIGLLFAWKILCPNKIYLLRGNHEDPEVNGDVSQYSCGSFLHKCIELFGGDSESACEGPEVWARINAVFARFPIAAVIDDTIFACHGGIPRLKFPFYQQHQSTVSQTQNVSVEYEQEPPSSLGASSLSEAIPSYFFDQLLCGDIDSVPIFNTVMPVESDAVDVAVLRRLQRELMWNDPVPDFSDAPQTDGCPSGDTFGFRPNVGRGDNEGIILEFNQHAIQTFLGYYGWSLILRAHQHKKGGLQLTNKAKIITLFTSANYGGEVDAAGACLVCDGAVRLVSWDRAATVLHAARLQKTNNTKEVQNPQNPANCDLSCESAAFSHSVRLMASDTDPKVSFDVNRYVDPTFSHQLRSETSSFNSKIPLALETGTEIAPVSFSSLFSYCSSQNRFFVQRGGLSSFSQADSWCSGRLPTCVRSQENSFPKNDGTIGIAEENDFAAKSSKEEDHLVRHTHAVIARRLNGHAKFLSFQPVECGESHHLTSLMCTAGADFARGDPEHLILGVPRADVRDLKSTPADDQMNLKNVWETSTGHNKRVARYQSSKGKGTKCG